MDSAADELRSGGRIRVQGRGMGRGVQVNLDDVWMRGVVSAAAGTVGFGASEEIRSSILIPCNVGDLPSSNTIQFPFACNHSVVRCIVELPILARASAASGLHVPTEKVKPLIQLPLSSLARPPHVAFLSIGL
nr:hypothetical protein Iba_chr05aCG0980 [Ipomoea batatas]GMD50397.1 hypothetical protein Iba_scaffold46897CG0010 [Ipomoea batatas]